jgi:type I site-specific restriction endonuclease
MPNEADTCRTFVVPKLQAAGWDADPHHLKVERGKRGKPKRAASNRFHLGVQQNGEEITHVGL